MAKESFTCSKPHITVARQQLLQARLSAAGVEQLFDGQPILLPDDRKLVAQIVTAVFEGGVTAFTRKVIGVTK
jgi:hypothetical protein